jgi:hypothetical protein
VTRLGRLTSSSGRSALVAAWVFITAVAAWGATPPGTAFTYQGQLKRHDGRVNDTADFVFTLWDDAGIGQPPVGGLQVGEAIARDNVTVVDGLFTVYLDFGAAAFNGQQRWLQIELRSPHDESGLGSMDTLAPRQPLTAAPYALQTRGLFVTETGDVGVGTVNPSQQLSVAAGAVIDQEGLQDGTSRSRALTFGGPTSQEAIASRRTPGGNQFGLDFYTQSFALPPRMSITNAGNVGIATSSPQVPLHIAGSTGEGLPPSLVAGTLLLAQQNNIDNWAHMTILAGRFGRAQLNFGDADNDRQGAISYNNSTDAMDIQVNAATRMTINPSGNVGIGTTSPSDKLHVVGNIRASGSVFASCGTLVCSDTRYKTNVRPVERALAVVEKLRPVRFDWKRQQFPDQHFTANRQVGLIAQEVREVLPEVVQEDSNGYLAVDYGRLTPLLVEAVNELQHAAEQKDREITRQQEQIKMQNKQIAGLTARLERIEKMLVSDIHPLEDSK